MMELYGTEQVAQWNSEWCHRAVRYKEKFSQLRSTVGSKVIPPIHTPWGSGGFVIYLHQKIAIYWLHIFRISGLSLCQTKSCGWMSMYIAKIYAPLIRFLDFTSGGSFLKVILWNKYSVSLSFLWSDKVCGSELCLQKAGRSKRWLPLFLPWGVYYIHDIFLQHISLSFYSDLSLPPFILYIDHFIRPSDHPQQGVYSTKSNSKTSAYCNCADSLLIHQTLTAFSKWLHNFPLFCSYAVAPLPAIMLHGGDFTLRVTAEIQFQARCDNENLNI